MRPVQGFPGIYVVGPKEEDLKAGETYRFGVDKAKGQAQVVATVDGESLSASTALDLHVGPVTIDIITVAVGASCLEEISAFAKSASRQGWTEARLAGESNSCSARLSMTMSIGSPRKDMCLTDVPGRSWKGIGQDQIFVSCEKTPRAKRTDESSFTRYEAEELTPTLRPLDYVKLLPGQHKLRVEAFLPGTEISLKDAGKDCCTELRLTFA